MSYNNNNISLPDRIQDIINTPLDPSLIKQREVNKVAMSYISGSTVVDLLNKAFDYMWDWIVDKAWIETSAPYFNKYAKNKTDTYNDTEGAWVEQAPVAHVQGRLIVYFKNEDGTISSITKTGFGSKCIIGKQSEQDSIYKAADTDALKKAASRLGIGNELYRSEEEQALFIASNDPYAWTNEMLYKFEKQIDYMNNAFEAIPENEQLKILQGFDITMTSITNINPVNIESFVEYLKDYIHDRSSKKKTLNFELPS